MHVDGGEKRASFGYYLGMLEVFCVGKVEKSVRRRRLVRPDAKEIILRDPWP